MEIKPVGLERDRQIAIEKNDLHEIVGKRCGFVKCECGKEFTWMHGELPHWAKEHFIIKPFSTDIASAFELLEEMKYEFEEIELTWIKDDEEWLLRPYKTVADVGNNDHAFEMRESMPAGAISGAYVTWKGRGK